MSRRKIIALIDDEAYWKIFRSAIHEMDSDILGTRNNIEIWTASIEEGKDLIKNLGSKETIAVFINIFNEECSDILGLPIFINLIDRNIRRVAFVVSCDYWSKNSLEFYFQEQEEFYDIFFKDRLREMDIKPRDFSDREINFVNCFAGIYKNREFDNYGSWGMLNKESLNEWKIVIRGVLNKNLFPKRFEKYR